MERKKNEKYICVVVKTKNGGYLAVEKELIRCKDCKYFTDCGCIRMEGMVICKEDDYCSKAEKEEDQEA